MEFDPNIDRRNTPVTISKVTPETEPNPDLVAQLVDKILRQTLNNGTTPSELHELVPTPLKEGPREARRASRQRVNDLRAEHRETGGDTAFPSWYISEKAGLRDASTFTAREFLAGADEREVISIEFENTDQSRERDTFGMRIRERGERGGRIDKERSGVYTMTYRTSEGQVVQVALHREATDQARVAGQKRHVGISHAHANAGRRPLREQARSDNWQRPKNDQEG